VNTPAAGTPGRSLVIADPDYDLEPAKTRKAGSDNASTSRGLLPFGPARRLPGTVKEANALVPKLQKYADEKGLVPIKDKEATETLVKSAHGPRVLSIGTHGYFLEDVQSNLDQRVRGRSVLDNPLLRCGLFLAGANNRDKAAADVEDGVLTGLEIVGCDLRGTEIVMLSACETSTGKVNSGEGVAGLRQAFQLAGARMVVGTLWEVPDTEGTVDIVSGFFANLAAGKDKADALRAAQLSQLEHRRSRKNPAAHPFFWAAFTLTGN
jgi:CHAT domain-containing protein